MRILGWFVVGVVFLGILALLWMFFLPMFTLGDTMDGNGNPIEDKSR